MKKSFRIPAKKALGPKGRHSSLTAADRSMTCLASKRRHERAQHLAARPERERVHGQRPGGEDELAESRVMSVTPVAMKSPPNRR